ncbi:stringent starvation protein B [Nicoletella semolina]|uniref:Stringent starvation protein B n=1 Tax=Nicoletella semolina TaxID=271160 RepID=A0A4R2NAM6_9PAST|nr:ClpXP protease specificity-enhancing factor [Nicoletella semolina]MDH2924044.1 ClpXP protease specificity-enhancing factor [Nicoletella semolina]TCP18179.1 stringent starvation protein B [Nicoletella semolina]
MKPLRPYLYSAYYQWILDSDYTPYLIINAHYPDVDVPQEYIKEGNIILNIAPRSIGQYIFNDEFIRFNARFQGMLRDIYLPLGAINAIYAQETGDGIIFQAEDYYSEVDYKNRKEKMDLEKLATESTNQAKPKSGKLKLVK